MTVEVVRSALLWCTVINFVVLAFWSVLMLLPHQWLYRLWAKWYRLTPELFDAISLAGIIFYKTLIILFNLVPYIALHIVA